MSRLWAFSESIGVTQISHIGLNGFADLSITHLLGHFWCATHSHRKIRASLRQNPVNP
jgi:hypothetical protein